MSQRVRKADDMLMRIGMSQVACAVAAEVSGFDSCGGRYDGQLRCTPIVYTHPIAASTES